MQNLKERRMEKDGRCFLAVNCKIPDLPDSKAGAHIKKILQDLSEVVLRSAEQALSSLSRQYEEDTDPKKAFRHRPLSLFLEFFLEEEKQVYRIPWALRLLRAGRILSQKNGEAYFDKRSGYLLGKQKNKKRKKQKDNAKADNR